MKKSIIWLTVSCLVIIAFSMVSCVSAANEEVEVPPQKATTEPLLTLPGQTKPASALFVKTFKSVQVEVNRPINIYDMRDHPNPESVNQNKGLMEWSDKEAKIWLTSRLPSKYDIQEATAAHELAHVLQKVEGYHTVGYWIDEEDQVIFPLTDALATSINSLVKDAPADNWAAKRGFKVVERLKEDALPEALQTISELVESEYKESTNWDEYDLYLIDISSRIEGSPPIPTDPPAEIKTQIFAIRHYATLKHRLSQFNLFSPELDDLFIQHYPETREIGLALLTIVKQIENDSVSDSNNAMREIIEHLGIPFNILPIE